MVNIINDKFQPSDELKLNDTAIKQAIGQHKFTRGRLFIKTQDESGKEILKKVSDNSVVFGGAIVALEKLCGVTAKYKPPTLNSLYDIQATGITGNNSKIALFGVGTGGSGLEFTSVIAPDIKQKDIIDHIPIRYGSALTGEDSDKYYLKKEKSPGLYEWYAKEFDGDPVVTSYWKNSIDSASTGTEITQDIHDSQNTEGIETLAEFHFSLNQYDIKEYFQATSSMANARYNTFGFYIGEKGDTEYGDVRLFSVVTFKNRDVDIDKAQFVYKIYTLI